MSKKFLLCIIALILSLSTLTAQSKEIDYYSIGFNDAVNRHKFDSKYSIENLAKNLKTFSTEDEKIEFVENAESYNLGYASGICKEQGIDTDDYYSMIYDYIKDYSSHISVTAIPTSEEYVSGQREILDWYTDLGIVQTETSDKKTVRVDIAIGYKKDDKATSLEIAKRTTEIKAFLRRYFNGKSSSELRNTSNEDTLENEIKNGINDKILSSGRIRDIVFQQKDVL